MRSKYKSTNKLFTLYIGSNNETKQLELDKIKKRIGEFFDGFTLSECVGYWHGSEERTARIEINTNEKDSIKILIQVLKDELKQDFIAYKEEKSLVFA
jgi:hypothetical protein